MIGISLALFIVGVVPHLLLAFFSPGLASEGTLGILFSLFSLTTLAALVISTRKNKKMWFLVFAQLVFMSLVVYESLSGANLYFGT